MTRKFWIIAAVVAVLLIGYFAFRKRAKAALEGGSPTLQPTTPQGAIAVLQAAPPASFTAPPPPLEKTVASIRETINNILPDVGFGKVAVIPQPTPKPTPPKPLPKLPSAAAKAAAAKGRR